MCALNSWRKSSTTAYPFPLPRPFNGLMSRVGHRLILVLSLARNAAFILVNSHLSTGSTNGVETIPDQSAGPSQCQSKEDADQCDDRASVYPCTRPHFSWKWRRIVYRKVSELLSPDLSPSHPHKIMFFSLMKKNDQSSGSYLFKSLQRLLHPVSPSLASSPTHLTASVPTPMLPSLCQGRRPHHRLHLHCYCRPC